MRLSESFERAAKVMDACDGDDCMAYCALRALYPLRLPKTGLPFYMASMQMVNTPSHEQQVDFLSKIFNSAYPEQYEGQGRPWPKGARVIALLLAAEIAREEGL